MNKIERRIRLYEGDIKDLSGLNLSPFEFIETLHVRDRLFEEFSDLSPENKEILHECDKIFLDNAEKIYEHISKVYDWENDDRPLLKWWWHLDKLVADELKVDLDNYKIEYKDEYSIKEYYFLNKSNDMLERFEKTDSFDKYTLTHNFITNNDNTNKEKSNSNPVRVA
jgi:YHS domain-containing protein